MTQNKTNMLKDGLGKEQIVLVTFLMKPFGETMNLFL